MNAALWIVPFIICLGAQQTHAQEKRAPEAKIITQTGTTSKPAQVQIDAVTLSPARSTKNPAPTKKPEANVATPTSASSANTPLLPAAPPAGPSHTIKKKIVTAAFAVRQPTQVEDIDDIAHGLAEQLSLRLNASKLLLSQTSPFLLPALNDDSFVTHARQMARLANSQFLIAGEVRDAGITQDKKLFGLRHTPRRHIEIDLVVLDSDNSTILARHTLHRDAISDVPVGRGLSFGSQAFYASEFGTAISDVIDDAVKQVTQDVQSPPVLATVTKIAGTQLTIDAGSLSGVEEGDLISTASGAAAGKS